MRASLLVVGFACLFGIAGACAKGDALDSFEEDGDGGSGGRNTASKSSASGLNGPGPAQSSSSSGSNGPSSTTNATSSVVSSTNNSTVASSSSGGIDCDPENPGPGCGAAQHCVPQMSGDPTCEAAGAGTDYQLCPNGRSQCAPIYECVFDGSDQCCMRWCQVALDNCGGVETCTSFQTPVHIDGVEYGVCWDGLPCVI